MCEGRCLLKSDHSFFSAGFRPFFLIAFISGAILPFIWALTYLNVIDLRPSSVNALQWHAHEMLFGFGWAVLAGFLLTASKNWLKIPGLHGIGLIVAVIFWITERVAISILPSSAPWLVRLILLNSFVLFVSSYVGYCLVRFRKQDSFRDNYFFIIALPLFLVAKVLLLNIDTYILGWSMSIGLFRMAFAVMFERTIPQFMRTTTGASLFMSSKLNLLIKFLILISVFEAFMPSVISAFCLAAAGALFLIRLLLWQPMRAIKHFGVGIMYVGSLGLSLNLILTAGAKFGLGFIGSLPVHVFTFLCMGVVIPGMMIRISQGHTGRPIKFTLSDRLAITLIFIAAASRLIATQLWPQFYTVWIGAAGILWSLCFIIIGVRLTPFLFQPRIDVKPH